MKTIAPNKTVAPAIVAAAAETVAPAAVVRPMLKASPISAGVLSTDSRSILTNEAAGRHAASIVLAFAFGMLEMLKHAPRTLNRFADQVPFIRDAEGNTLNRSQTIKTRLVNLGIKAQSYAERPTSAMILGHADSILRNTLNISEGEHFLSDLLAVAEQTGQTQPTEGDDNIPF